MSSHARHFKNDGLDKLPRPDYHAELLASLERINTYNPPVHTCSTGWSFSGLYKGPTSIAFLFNRLSQFYPDLTFKSQSLQEWAEDYLKLGDVARKSHVDPDHCGVANEMLAHLAVSAVIRNDPSLAEKLGGYNSVINSEGGGSNEWLYGRAGYLYFLRLCRTHFKRQDGITKSLDQAIENTVGRILNTPPPWTWHGKQYMGAAHGYFGIITQLALSNPGTLKYLDNLLNKILDTQFSSGNFPSSVDGSLGENAAAGSDRLIQFCHDLQKRLDTALENAREDTWRRGLLTKEPCLCHGIAGNALCFTDLGDERFEKFLAAMSSEMLEDRAKGWMEDAGVTDEFAGLWTGEAGRAWVWAVADKGLERRCIGFSDV
ncbi:hypothetical protein LTR70_000478 [Exophiala xenobiotica]|uniref:Uncharacterized protein n=1 Tax=Lithohypha guttulata TaxID=1690604 RepID=A0ABR0K167_9EURO|nr:hypothetical protein LTR24_008391 [Lithohypha guttulata]KAK5330648.1 hypothetical protein LTR70_000478 [Exophiala xenobiotica]